MPPTGNLQPSQKVWLAATLAVLVLGLVAIVWEWRCVDRAARVHWGSATHHHKQGGVPTAD